MNTNGIVIFLLQIAAIFASTSILYGFQKWINSNLEIDEENVAAIERARTLRRQKHQYKLEKFQITDLVDLPLLEISN
jgi:hypothetical protein